MIEQTIELNLPRLHPEQEKILADPARFVVVMAGRRGGKSTLARYAAVMEMLKGRPVFWLEHSYKYLMDSFREMQMLLKPAIARKSEEEHRLVIHNGGSIDFWSAEAGEPSRGRGYALAILDESGLITKLEQIWTQAVRPALADYQGRAFFLGTPRRASGYFVQLFDSASEKENWAAYRFGSAANPHLPSGEVEQARRELPMLAFQQEWEGLPIAASESAVFRDIEAALVDGPLPEFYERWRPPSIFQREKQQFFIGCDWAGAGRKAAGDYTAYVVVSDGHVCHIDRFKADYATQRLRLQGLIERFRPAGVLAESNSIGSVQLSELRRSGLEVQGFTTTAVTKAKAVELLALGFESHTIKIPDIPNRAALVAELSNYEATALPNGLTRYAACAGQHDDLTTALWLSWTAGHRQAGGYVGRGDPGFGFVA